MIVFSVAYQSESISTSLDDDDDSKEAKAVLTSNVPHPLSALPRAAAPFSVRLHPLTSSTWRMQPSCKRERGRRGHENIQPESSIMSYKS
jgi:hypothetical protein